MYQGWGVTEPQLAAMVRGGLELAGIPQSLLRTWRLCSHHRVERGQQCVCVWRGGGMGGPLKVLASSGFRVAGYALLDN